MLSHLWQYPSLFGAMFQKYTDIGCHLYSLLLTTVSTRHAQSATHAYICTLYCSPLYQQGTHNQLHMLTSVLSIAHHCINKARTISYACLHLYSLLLTTVSTRHTQSAACLHLYSLLLTTVSTRHAQSATHAYICTLYCSPLYQQGTHNQLHAYICTLYCSPLYQQGTHNQLRMLTSVLSIAHHCINKARTISCMLTSVLSIAHHCINKARTISYTCLHPYSLLLTTVSTRHAQSAMHAYICTLYCSPLYQQGTHNQLRMLTSVLSIAHHCVNKACTISYACLQSTCWSERANITDECPQHLDACLV